MSYTGKVQNGVVVLPPDARLPDGTEVEVIPTSASPEETFLHDAAAVSVSSDLPDDLAANHDYYLHGLRKQQPRRGRWISAPGSEAEMSEEECVTYTEQLRRFAAETHNLPPDLAANHNHYLHGLPKR